MTAWDAQTPASDRLYHQLINKYDKNLIPSHPNNIHKIELKVKKRYIKNINIDKYKKK